MTTAKEHIEWLKQHYKDDEVLAVAIWQVDDVLVQAEERGIKVSKEQAEDILERIDRMQDATLGITWDTIDCYLDELEDK